MSIVKVAKKRFTKHFRYDENNFVEDNFGLRLIYHRVILPQDVSKYHLWAKLT